jgi:hypothetical protein
MIKKKKKKKRETQVRKILLRRYQLFRSSFYFFRSTTHATTLLHQRSSASEHIKREWYSAMVRWSTGAVVHWCENCNARGFLASLVQAMQLLVWCPHRKKRSLFEQIINRRVIPSQISVLQEVTQAGGEQILTVK